MIISKIVHHFYLDKTFFFEVLNKAFCINNGLRLKTGRANRIVSCYALFENVSRCILLCLVILVSSVIPNKLLSVLEEIFPVF